MQELKTGKEGMTEGMSAIQEAERQEEMRAFVHEKFPQIEFPAPVKEPIWYGKLKKERYPDKFAIINGKNRKQTFNIVSDQYKIVTHEEVLYNAVQTLDRFQEFGTPDFKITTANNGGRMNFEIVFPEVKYEVRENDNINPRFILKNSYDSSWRLKTMFGAFRLVCSNGMIIGKKISETSNKHTLNLDINSVFETFSLGMETFSEQTKLFSTWAETKIGLPMYENIVEELPISETELEKIQVKPVTGSENTLEKLLKTDSLTVWELNNALTEYITHDIQSENRRSVLEERVGRTLHQHFGTLKVQ